MALGQFYHVAVSNQKPYWLYGGLQDNGSWGLPSVGLKGHGPLNEDVISIGGGDGFVCRVDPNDPDLVYSESQGGAISRRNLKTGERPRFVPVGAKAKVVAVVAEAEVAAVTSSTGTRRCSFRISTRRFFTPRPTTFSNRSTAATISK